jgi:demethylmenaquinone methyltransferase/2-methoxy-6-polyprenyl-1,4-benzoquinol methylase
MAQRGRVLGPDGALPEGADKRHAIEAMFDRVAPDYDRMNRVISLGQDGRWRRHTLRALALGRDARVLDLACGTGDFCHELEAQGLRPVGLDFSAGMLARARVTAPLVRGDGARLPFADGAFDGVVCGFALRNFVDLDEVFRETARVLRPGGRLAALDAAVPANAILRAGHAVWFRGAVPALGKVLARDAEAYRYLPRSTAYLPDPPELVHRLDRSGFTGSARRTLMGGSVQILTGTRT